MDKIKSQIKNLNIPYPQRHLLELEVTQDLEHGMETADGTEPQLSADTLSDLYNVHATSLDRFLNQFGGNRRYIELLTAFIPLITSVIFIITEDSMVEFMREGGGPGMYTILIIGLFLLGREMLNVIRIVVIKNHSPENLRLDTSSVLLGCLALMFIAVGVTTLGIYKSADAVIQAHLSYDLLITGIKESLTNMVLSSLLAGLVVLAHYATRCALRIWHAPLAE